MRLLLFWLLLSGIALADSDYYVKVILTPPEATFSVRHIKGVKIPGGPEPGALLPSGQDFKAGLVDGQRGIIVAVHEPGYQDFEQTYPLVLKKEYWNDASNGWQIPIELTPTGAYGQLKHQFRFHPLVPWAMVVGLATLVGVPMVLYARRAERARYSAKRRETLAEAAVWAAEQLKAELDPELIGKPVGDYDVLRRLGEGGFATVYLVKHRDYHDEFALKILKKGVYDSDTVSRMNREMRIGTSLVHPRLVRIVAFGEHRECPYLVMDYVQGRQLADLMEEKRLDMPQILDIMIQCCEGVAYAHSMGIIHRDLKPENIIITPAGDLKILDFGVAKPVEDQEKLTRTGLAFGTPAYMSPEQLRGNADVRTDIYALGVMLFEMVTGRLPFAGSEPMEVMAGHLFKAPPRLASLVPTVPAAMESLCQAMLMKKVEERIQTADEVLRRLKSDFPVKIPSGGMQI